MRPIVSSSPTFQTTCRRGVALRQKLGQMIRKSASVSWTRWKRLQTAYCLDVFRRDRFPLTRALTIAETARTAVTPVPSTKSHVEPYSYRIRNDAIEQSLDFTRNSDRLEEQGDWTDGKGGPTEVRKRSGKSSGYARVLIV